MLTKSPINRLCKFANIKNDPWFAHFSWENLLSLNVEPPFLPKISTSHGKNSTVAYINYLKTTKEYVPSKSVKIEKEMQSKFDLWFKNF
jgi:hypothetical protein